MKTMSRIIAFFLDHPAPKTIREIAQGLNADYRIVHTATQRLIQQKILLSQPVGASTLCKLNPGYYGIELLSAEYARMEKRLNNSDVKHLRKEILVSMPTAYFTLLLFGSHAKQTATPRSDIDIALICEEKSVELVLQEKIALLPLPVHALFFTEKEFLRAKQEKKRNVVHEIIEHNVVLYGIETYCRLKNA